MINFTPQHATFQTINPSACWVFCRPPCLMPCMTQRGVSLQGQRCEQKSTSWCPSWSLWHPPLTTQTRYANLHAEEQGGGGGHRHTNLRRDCHSCLLSRFHSSPRSLRFSLQLPETEHVAGVKQEYWRCPKPVSIQCQYHVGCISTHSLVLGTLATRLWLVRASHVHGTCKR